MKVVVTGATGNVGTSVIQALCDSPEVDETVGVARRRPIWDPPKTTWVDADELLKRVAQRAGDEETVAVAERILAEERAAEEKIARRWDRPGVPLGVAS